MSDFELLKALQKELVKTLEFRRKNYEEKYPIMMNASRAKIRRMRLQIQDVMKRIERDCGTDVGCRPYGENWFKEKEE